MKKNLINFQYKNYNFYSNISLDLNWIEKNLYCHAGAEKTLNYFIKDIDSLIESNQKVCAGTYFFMEKHEDFILLISIYEPNSNCITINNVTSIVGHENLICVDLNNYKYIETHTR